MNFNIIIGTLEIRGSSILIHIRIYLVQEFGLILQVNTKYTTHCMSISPAKRFVNLCQYGTRLRSGLLMNSMSWMLRGIKPEMIDIDDKTEFRYELLNWLQDMEMEFSNSRMFEERIQLCNDAIELLACQEDSQDTPD